MEGKDQHILVCISASPTSRTVIRAAAASAEKEHCQFSALYVKERGGCKSSHELRDNAAYAEELGAKLYVLKDHSKREIMSFASNSGITDIYIGKSGSQQDVVRKGTVVDHLVQALPSARLHVVPDTDVVLKPSHLSKTERKHLNKKDLFMTILIMALATLVSLVIYQTDLSNANIITVYILAVLIASVMASDKVYGLFAAIIYILVFNLLFLKPRFSLKVYGRGYTLTYFVTVIAALLTGSVASRMKSSRAVAQENAYQTRVLLECSELLQHAHAETDMISIVCNQLVRLLKRSVVYYPYEAGKIGERMVFRMDSETGSEIREKEIVQWAAVNNHHAGAFTEVYEDAGYLYLSVRVGMNVYGVIGVAMPHKLSDFENNMLLSLVGECALSIENYRNIIERERVVAAAENERFRTNIVRSISHDLRTPLTSISGNATNLLYNEENISSAERKQIYSDIYDDAQWLITLVENLLSYSKLEEVPLHMSTEVLQDVIEEAVRHTDHHRSEHRVIIAEDDMMLVQCDVKLIIQVLINLVNNAVKYTPKGSTIWIYAKRRDGKIWVSVADDGEGVDEERRSHLFEMFYTCHNSVADSKRSLGLGLGLCSSIMKAHGQEIVYRENVPYGSVFEFSLKEADYGKVSDSLCGR